MNVFVKGLNSCGMRRADVEQYVTVAKVAGHRIVDDPLEAGLILLWTCGFRADSRDNSLAQIRRYKEYPAQLLVCGCLPDIDRAAVVAEGVDVMPWRGDDLRLTDIFGVSTQRAGRTVGVPLVCRDLEAYRREHPDVDVSFVSQFNQLLVAEGCNCECSYCSERLAFPPFQSFPVADITEVCRDLLELTGWRRFAILGDSIGDYGRDIGTSLPALIDHLRAEVDPGIRFALQGLNPGHVIREWYEFDRLLRWDALLHLQLPIQSASPRVLPRMRRPYDREGLDRVFGRLNDLGFTAFDTHLIVGFPGETWADVDETLDFILRHRPAYVLVSGYMETRAMPSARLPGKVEAAVRDARIAYLAEQIAAAEIICNADGGELAARRFATLNA